MSNGREWLEGIAKRMREEASGGAASIPETIVLRELLAKFNYERRGTRINRHIQNVLEKLGLRSVPDFTVVWIDDTLSIELASEDIDDHLPLEIPDPTLRIGSLPAAHISESPHLELVSVAPDQHLVVATTLMRLHDFSQLPVMPSGNDREVKGVVSWQTIGEQMALGRPCEFVRECMNPAPEIVPIETALFDAIGRITRHGYALVLRSDKVISGIVTASDLSGHFLALAGPFILLGQIEGSLRRLIRGRFTVEELRAAAEYRQAGDAISGSADLTLGDYCQLLGKKERWQNAQIRASRKEFMFHLNRVREIRNDVMHFDPDGLSDSDLESLRKMAHFVEQLTRAPSD